VFPGVSIAIFGFFLGNLYLRAQLSVKLTQMRDEVRDLCVIVVYRSHMLFSNAPSPLLAHFSAAIVGIGQVHLLVNSILNIILL
jgi:hypothetical protein